MIMSERVSVSVDSDDGDGHHFVVRHGQYTAHMRALRIEPSSNRKYPFRVLCEGGASLMLDSVECAQLISEGMRLSGFFRDTTLRYFCSEDTSCSFKAERKVQ